MLSSKPTIPIKELKGTRGSIVLEAALVLPFFIMFLFFFIYFVQMTIISTRMNMAVTNAVRQVSAHIYPVALAVHSDDGDPLERKGRELGLPRLSPEDLAKEYGSKLPEPLSGWLQSAAAAGQEPLENLKSQAAEAVLDPALKPILKSFVIEAGLELDRLHVTGVTVPDLKSGKTPYFAIEVSYVLPIRVPFVYRPVVLQTKAEERLWIGDTDELAGAGKGGDGEGGTGQAAVVLEKPNPALAGHKAKIRARLAPGVSATLSVYYKSGQSVAKYLGQATADSNGILEWNWLVGGNTTPGTWQFVIEAAEGARTVDIFTVGSPERK
ncbi:hypothetical protein DCC85_06125 [Paenibacillus sp. CAA11]|uniref:pilus assembly protein n=1 Tax=Paenibacillus sp. CAA11 TaxID=1532905 RepID=UPI000D343E52|nr:pilus assembly protein [Paenibacillus sp. CAA11]AWB43838.1 hypothetical protein DCC85_06125 [Paenibacillus sp. CAA11]